MIGRSARGYDRLARCYGGLERLVFGGALQEVRVALLPDVPPLRTALVLGEGPGFFLSAFLEAQPECRVSVLEQSPAMIEQARRRLGAAAARVRFVQGDLLRDFLHDFGSEPPGRDERYDLIVSTFFLDGFAPDALGALLPRLAAQLEPGPAACGTTRTSANPRAAPPDGAPGCSWRPCTAFFAGRRASSRVPCATPTRCSSAPGWNCGASARALASAPPPGFTAAHGPIAILRRSDAARTHPRSLVLDPLSLKHVAGTSPHGTG